MARVSLIKGSESYDAVARALNLIKDDIKVPSGPVLIKPNLVSANVDLCATPVGAVRAVLDLFQEIGVTKFIVGESTAVGGTDRAFERYGYASLLDDYDVDLVDLTGDETVEAAAYDGDCRPRKLRVSRTVQDSYRVSVARMKTHDSAIVTLAIKNMAVGSIVPNRSLLSHSYPAMNLTLARMNMDRPPHLSVIDGVVGMEGRGPDTGTAKPSGVALAGVNAAAVDMIGAQVMGYDPLTIGHLYYLSELLGFGPGDIDVLGENVQDCVTKYRDHPDYEAQLKWQVENWPELLQAPLPA